MQTVTNKLKNSATAKIIFILIMTMILMIPNMMIQDLIRERSSRKAKIEREVATSYGGSQRIIVPILKIPYTETYKNSEGKQKTTRGTYSFSPKSSKLNGTIQTDLRKRSIYEVVVYNSELSIEEIFDISNIDLNAYKHYEFDYKNAFFIYGISDPNGIKEESVFTVNNMDIKTKGLYKLTSSEFAWVETETFPINPQLKTTLSTTFKFKGTKSLMVEPIGEEFSMKLNSTWPDPSFVGKRLPVSHDITDSGFESKWSVNKYAHTYPKFWSNNIVEQDYNGFGVNLIQPVDQYGKNTRTAKYALLIISLTFGIFFLFEILYKKLIHPVQYILVGFAITIFFLLLLSITEHLGFDLGYLISSCATIGLIVTYASSILKNKKSTLLLMALLTGLFSYIFIILQMQDFALLAGALALFVVLAAVMLVSRNVDWFQLSKDND